MIHHIFKIYNVIYLRHGLLEIPIFSWNSLSIRTRKRCSHMFGFYISLVVHLLFLLSCVLLISMALGTWNFNVKYWAWYFLYETFMYSLWLSVVWRTCKIRYINNKKKITGNFPIFFGWTEKKRIVTKRELCCCCTDCWEVGGEAGKKDMRREEWMIVQFTWPGLE